MPLAVQKISLAELPAIVLLDDSMAMMEGMNLSSFDSVIISARITKTGSAMAQAGDYIGEYRVDDVAQASQVDIEINTLVQ
jgi:cytochrome c-type biogenesis protein CcmH